jgi:alanine dehydrogenase
VIVLSQREVAELLSMRECIDVMAGALAALARGESRLPLRSIIRLPNGRDLLGLMPAYVDAPAAVGAKIITVFHGNDGTELDSHQGVVLLFDASNGALTAILDATAITSIRTAAVSALATRLLAREDACDLAIIGSGVQARMHIASIPLVRPIERIRVWSRNSERARGLVASSTSDIPISVCASAEAAVRGASIICTTTSASEPVVRGEWVEPGAHLNVVGSAQPHAREVDTTTIVRSRVFVDSRVAATNEPGDILIPIREGAITADHVLAELGEILTGAKRGRETAEEITLFKSLGLAVEDIAAAQHVVRIAREQARGQHMELGGRRVADA